jgi:choline dehydrogenase-like flavoprotein
VFQWDNYGPTDPEGTLWDVVVVGTGMGGSVLGWSLARQNFSVLYLERGDPVSPLQEAQKSNQQWRKSGWLRRLFEAEVAAIDSLAIADRGRRITLRKDGKTTVEFYPALGSGPGGSSAIYGAALERFRREDFSGVDDETLQPKPLPTGWPIEYDDFIPYYEKAENLLRVRGTADPTDPDGDFFLRPPPPLSERDSNFFESFEAAGLAPYRLHVGIDYVPGCTECLGLCPMDCKAEGASRALKPALIDHSAKLLTGFEVARLDTANEQIKQVVGSLGDRELKIRGRVVVLAAGALNTPLILLNSISSRWPRGIGNSNDLVGRGIMFHAGDIFALWPTRKVSSVGPKKTLSSRALNIAEESKLGCIQSFLPSLYPSMVSEFIVGLFERNLRFRIPFLKVATTVAAKLAKPIFNNAALFSTILEDFPYFDNRIVSDPKTPSGFSISYLVTKELSFRTSLMRKLIKRRLANYWTVFLSSGENLNYGHPSGTCRFGKSPETSVLTPENKVRGVENLYIADASFFPSSGGINPALTIAANALRVADIIGQRLEPHRKTHAREDLEVETK